MPFVCTAMAILFRFASSVPHHSILSHHVLKKVKLLYLHGGVKEALYVRKHDRSESVIQYTS